MDAEPRRDSDIRTFLLLLSLVIVLSVSLLVVHALVGRVPLFDSLPGDISVILGTIPMRLPLGSCVVVSAVLTGLASLVSYLLRERS
jgi:hypothetical protein